MNCSAVLSRFLRGFATVGTSFFHPALNLPNNLGVLGLFLESPAIISFIEAHTGVLTEQTQKRENLHAFLFRKRVDLQIEMIPALAELRLSIQTDHENRRGVCCLEGENEIELNERIRIPNARTETATQLVFL
jgi:hypothetical protein